MAFLPVALPEYVVKDDETTLSNFEGAKLIDCYIDQRGYFRKREGLTLFADLSSLKPIDGLFWWDIKNVLIAVSNGRIFKITNNQGAFTEVTGTDKLQLSSIVSFTNNATHLVMANGGKMMLYDNSAAPFHVTDADAPINVLKVAHLDRYILALEKDSARFWNSAVANAQSWSATGFSLAENKPDNAISMLEAFGEIVMLGQKSTEFWFNSGIGTPPFRPIKQATLPLGGIAGDTLVDAAGSIMWFDNLRRIIKLDGRTPKPIESLIANELKGLTPVTDSRAHFMNIGNRALYVLTIPSNDKTYVYDIITGIWVEFGEWHNQTGNWDEWLGRTYAYSPKWDLHLTGSKKTGKIYKIDKDNYQDEGNPIRSLIRTGHNNHKTNGRKTISELRIKMLREAGGTSGNEPVIQIRWKDDNKGWGNWRQVSMGKLGESEFFARIYRLGQYRTRQYEIVHSDNSDFIFVGMEEDVEFDA